MVYRLPYLEQLDKITVSSDERIRASNLYNSEGGDLQLRQDVLNKYYPEENFEDFSPYFEDDELDIKVSELMTEITNVSDPVLKELLSQNDYAEVTSVAGGVLLDVTGVVSRSE